jgi:hypothetical protein
MMLRSFAIYFFYSLIFSFSVVNPCLGQDTIFLANASFEDIPRRGGAYYTPIKGWQDCGSEKFPGESPPDIHPVPGAAWQVIKKPYDGQTYLGLVVRYNNTYESVSQKLTSPLELGKCYTFSAFLARSTTYVSATRRSSVSNQTENFSYPAVIRVWGGDEFCWNGQFLAQSEQVENSEWKNYTFQFKAAQTHSFITIEAYYAPASSENYNGHVLVDAISPIVEVKCD